MHPTLAAFADRYRHAFPDLVITATPDGEDLRIEWQEGPEAPCYAVTARISGEGFIVVKYSRGRVRAVADPPIASAVIALSRERDFSDQSAPILAAPGTFGALVLERRLLRDSPTFASPDRLN